MLNQYQLSDCGYCFSRGEKKSMAVSKEGVFIIPIMREAMKTVLDANTHLNDRASSMLAQLSGVHAQKLEPTYDELNPPPEIPKEYRYSMGDTVYLGSLEYEVLFIGEEEVRLYDASFPLINKVVPRSEFDSRLKENPLNGHLLVESVTPMENLKNTLSVFDREAEQMQEAKDLINDFCVEEYQEEADFSDPFHVALAYSTTEDSRHDIEVEVSLPEKRIIFFVDRDIVSALQCASVDDLNAYPTAITQNVEYLLDSVQASTMLSNSEFIVMLNQAAPDREKLARLLSISPEQMSYITDVEPGCGLIKYGSTLVPFVNKFPKDTKLYELMTTKPGEGVFAGASNDDKQ